MPKVFCRLLRELKPAMEKAPFPGPLGEELQRCISQEAWEIWLEQQTRLINEHRLNLQLPKDRIWLMGVMENFLLHDE